jgi:hypothetical protein
MPSLLLHLGKRVAPVLAVLTSSDHQEEADMSTALQHSPRALPSDGGCAAAPAPGYSTYATPVHLRHLTIFNLSRIAAEAGFRCRRRAGVCSAAPLAVVLKAASVICYRCS